jgi:hypothetical protein
MLLKWLFGFDLFPELVMSEKFYNDMIFQEKCNICKNCKMRCENMNPADIVGLRDRCKNDTRKNTSQTRCSNYEKGKATC